MKRTQTNHQGLDIAVFIYDRPCGCGNLRSQIYEFRVFRTHGRLVINENRDKCCCAVTVSWDIGQQQHKRWLNRCGLHPP